MPTQRDSPQRARIPQHFSENNLPVRNMLRNNNSLRNGSPVVANHFIGSQGTIGSHGTHGYPPGNYNYPPSVMSNVSHTPSNGSSNSEEVITNTFRIVDYLRLLIIYRFYIVHCRLNVPFTFDCPETHTAQVINHLFAGGI